MNPFRQSPLFLLLLPLLIPAYSYRDHSHYSNVFKETRHFRVYYPPSYDSNSIKTYPVIYYCHGCAGSYQGDSYTSYRSDGNCYSSNSDGCTAYSYNCSGGPPCDPTMNRPFNADFQMFVDSNDVIIVLVDGTGFGCAGWLSGIYDFRSYFPELFHVVDSLYKTKASPQYRAVSGLSMGGDGALWFASQTPHLFRSASSFCYSSTFKSIDSGANATFSDPQQLWRNFRGLSMRTHANNQDYLHRYSQQMGVLLNGAGFPNEYHENIFWRHWACHIDSQFNFHLRTFSTLKPNPACFSYVTVYPDFEVWGYELKSGKAEPGWIYLRDVTKTSLSVLTRYRLPYGKSLSRFPIQLITPPLYGAQAVYTLSAYDYRRDSIFVSSVTADDSGRITITDSGGMGREYGLSGNGLKPALTLLTDTLNETIWLRAGVDSALSFDLVNLGETALSNVRVLVKTDNTFLRVVGMHGTLASVGARSRVALDSMAVLSATYTRWQNIGYIKAYFIVGQDTLDKEHIIQVHVMDSMPCYDSTLVTLYEGANVVRNVDTGKIYSIWVTYPYQDVQDNQFVSNPIVPINGCNNSDISFEDYNAFLINRARQLVEAKFRFNRRPTNENPIVVPFMVEMNYTDPSPGSDKGIDEDVYRYGRIVFPNGAIGVENPSLHRGLPASVTVLPNPFNPVIKIRVAMAEGLLPETIAIYSTDGRKVRSFVPKSLGYSGALFWDGKDDHGKPLSSGLYLFRAGAQGKSVQRMLVYLK